MKSAVRNDIVKRFVACLIENGITLVCSDFDDTITCNDKRYVSKTFQMLCHELKANNIDIAITTFNMGYDIKSLLKRRKVPVEDIPFPVFRRASKVDFSFGKFWHITQAMQFFELSDNEPHRVLLLDDLDNNVQWARKFGICALEVQKRKGLSPDDLLRCMANVGFYFPYNTHLVNRGFIPSASSVPKTEQGKTFHFAKSIPEAIPFPTVINLISQKDCSGQHYLLGMKWNDIQKKPEYPFLVVSTRIPCFLSSMNDSLQEVALPT